MQQCVTTGAVPHLDRSEPRILWSGVDTVPALNSAKRGGCFG